MARCIHLSRRLGRLCVSRRCAFVWGWDANNPSTRAKAPNQTEYDFDVDYRPALTGAILQGIWFRFRSAVVDQQDAKRIGYQFRIIINWDRDLI